ncbi:uncharacterized protein LOC109862722, partial [Pseudomyrmex gracilis]|uniref:uncharacterized protein LOC109862722 n=1 Tax=Pseudomyrmex gracilis TaxID=219809 RepID=UPI00099550BD
MKHHSCFVKIPNRGLSFRGTDEKFGSLTNGNYMGLFELLAEYDPFLKVHIETNSDKGRGSVSYLSKTTLDEFLELLRKNLTKKIIEGVKLNKYYSISVDSTPDIRNIDQLVFILRYMTEDADPVERFIKFIPMSNHKASTIERTVMDTLSELDLHINDCRNQSYDNAINMGGSFLLTSSSETRWYARRDACRALAKSYDCFYQTFLQISETSTEKAEVIAEAKGYCAQLNMLKTRIFTLLVEFQQRKEAYLEVNELFGFLHKLRIDDVNVVEEIRKKSGNLIEKYADLESELIEECIHFQELILDMSKRYTENDLDQASSTPLQCFKFIKSKKLLISLFPNLETAL